MESTPLVRRKPTYKPFVAACALAALLCGVAVVARPSMSSSMSSLATMMPDPRWDCDGAVESVGRPVSNIEDSGLGINVKLVDTKGKERIIKPGKEYKVEPSWNDVTNNIQIVVDPYTKGKPEADIYAFWFNWGLYDSNAFGNPYPVNTANTVNLVTVPTTNETCGFADFMGTRLGAPICNGVPPGLHFDAPVEGEIVAGYTTPKDIYYEADCQYENKCVQVMIVAGPEKTLYQSRYAISVYDPYKKDSASRTLANVAVCAVGGLAALLALA